MKNIHSFDFLLKKNEMVLEQIEKSKYAQINVKRYYLGDGIVSLPFSHPFLHEINQFKKDKNQKIEAFLLEEKDKLLLTEKISVAKNQRFSLYRSILQQNPLIYHLYSTKRNVENHNINFSQTTRSYIVNNFW